MKVSILQEPPAAATAAVMLPPCCCRQASLPGVASLRLLFVSTWLPPRHRHLQRYCCRRCPALPYPATPIGSQLPHVKTTHLLLTTHKPVDRHTQRLIRRRSNRLRTPQLECLHIHISQPPTLHLSSHSHRYPDHNDTSPRRSAQSCGTRRSLARRPCC